MKTKLGISVGLVAAATYLVALGGLTPLLLVAGYIFIVEESDFLKKTAVKALTVILGVYVCSFVISLFPTVVDIGLSFLRIFGVHLTMPNFISYFFGWLSSILNLLRNVLLVVLAAMALREKTIKIPAIDKMEL